MAMTVVDLPHGREPEAARVLAAAFPGRPALQRVPPRPAAPGRGPPRCVPRHRDRARGCRPRALHVDDGRRVGVGSAEGQLWAPGDSASPALATVDPAWADTSRDRSLDVGDAAVQPGPRRGSPKSVLVVVGCRGTTRPPALRFRRARLARLPHSGADLRRSGVRKGGGAPTSGSWLNLVEVFFGIITRQAIRRGTFPSVKDLITAIENFIDGWNERCHPFTWTKTADQILTHAKPKQRKQTSFTRH
jgi:hypothetical protein